MFDEQKDRLDHLDELLDSLLSGYSAAEPRPGLETRILANVRAQAAQRRRASIATLAAAAAMLMIGLIVKPHPVKPIASPNVARQATLSISAGDHHKTASPSRKETFPRNDTNRAMNNHAGNATMLQVAEAMRGKGSLLFDQQKLYLSVPPQPESDVAPEPSRTSAPNLAIPEVGVQPITVKELNLASEDEKGKL
jgi:hypothetical protein